MRNSFSIVLLTIVLSLVNANAQMRNGHWKTVYDGTEKDCKFFSNMVLDMCPVCQNKIPYTPGKEFKEYTRRGRDFEYRCNYCNSEIKVRWSYSTENGETERVVITVKKGERKQQAREHKITDECVFDYCYLLADGTPPNTPTQHIAIARARCKFAIEFTIIEEETKRTETRILPQGQRDFFMNADGKTYRIVNVRHVIDSNAKSEQNKTITTKQKRR